MKSIQNFLELYRSDNTRRVYRAGIFTFLEFIYNFKRNGSRATNAEIIQFENYATKYFNENRDHTDDLMRFAAHLHEKPPETAKSYVAATEQFLGYNNIELSHRQLKTISLKLPKGGTRTIEKDMDRDTIRKIISHMDIKGRALILILASSGMRIGEALSVTLNDLDINASSPVITIRGKNSKNGFNRYTFISAEAKEALIEWLKVREQYIRSAQNKNKGLIENGTAKVKSLDDNRVFPFSSEVANQFWENALKKAELLSFDEVTNRTQLRMHQLRKFFRSQLALKCPVEIVEALMGHEGYLTDVYRRYTKAQISEFYKNNEYLLYIQASEDIKELKTTISERIDKQSEILEDVLSENRILKKKLENMKGLPERMVEMETEITELKKLREQIDQIMNYQRHKKQEINRKKRRGILPFTGTHPREE